MQMRRVRRTAPAVAAVVALWAMTAAPAIAKAVPVLEACGANACRETTDAQTLRLLVNIGDPGQAPPHEQQTRWFRMALTETWDAGHGGQGRDGWVMRSYPDAGMMRDHGVWVQLPDATIARFEQLTRGLDVRGAVASVPTVVAGADSTASSGGGGLAAVASVLATAGLA